MKQKRKRKQKKNDYISELEKRLREWQGKLDLLKEKVQVTTEKAHEEYKAMLETVRPKIEEAQAKVAALKDASEERWEELQKSADLAQTDLQNLMTSAKELYVVHVEGTLIDWRTKINDFKAQADAMQEKVTDDYRHLVTDARTKLEATQTKLHDLQEASGEAWHELKDGVEKAWRDCAQAIEQARKKFSKTRPETKD